MNLTPLSPVDYEIGLAIIDAIGNNGILSQDIEAIFEGLKPQLGEELTQEEVMAVLHRIQHFDPPGIAATSLEECLLIQLRQFPEDTPWLMQAKTLIKRHLNLLGTRDYTNLMRRMRLKEHELKEVVDLIQMLNPAPGDQFDTQASEYVVPDVVVKKHEGVWRVFLNNDLSPRLSINETYASLIKRGDTSSDNQYLRDQLQEARWFIKSLESRNETLLKVLNYDFSVRWGYFLRGTYYDGIKYQVPFYIFNGFDIPLLYY